MQRCSNHDMDVNLGGAVGVAIGVGVVVGRRELSLRGGGGQEAE